MSEPQTGGSDFQGVRPAAVQRGKAVLVSRCAGVQHARSRAALHCAGSAPQCSIASPLEAARRAAALHYSSRSGIGSAVSACKKASFGKTECRRPGVVLQRFFAWRQCVLEDFMC